MRSLRQSTKLSDVCYDIRGPVLVEAKRMEDEGHRILKLNIGNPAPFGFEAPEEIAVDFARLSREAHGYSDSKGILPARRAIAQYYQTLGVPTTDVESIYLGNGVSELIVMALQAMLDTGDEVLVPMPDYPLWTAAVTLAGGKAVHYVCDETNGWQPAVDDIAAKITDRTKAIVVINPNNPTGAVYSEEILDAIAGLARHHGLVLMSDEIYDKILYDDAKHVPMAKVAPDLFTLTFNGLSKSYRVAGYRSGWMMLNGPMDHARNYIEGLDILSNMRLCANHPAQHVVATALGGHQSINDLVLPSGRLGAQRDVAYELINQIPGVSAVKPMGALYIFPRLDPAVYPIQDDEQFVMDLLRQERILVVQGTGFNWPTPDHFRLVTLPRVEDLTDAIGRIERFLGRLRKEL